MNETWSGWRIGVLWVAIIAALSGSALSARAADKRAVDLRKSRIYIFVGKTGLGHEHGVEGHLKSGELLMGSADHAGKFVFDMKSFHADTEAARKYVGLEGHTSESTRRQVDANMLGAKVLNVEKYPTAIFEIDSAKMLGRASRRGYPLAELDGRFTLHGVTRRIRILTEVIEQRGETRVRGGFRIRQSDYKIKPFSKAFGAIGVADELRIYGEIVLAAHGADSAASQAQGSGGRRR